RYDLYFEAFSSSLEMPRKGREAAVHAVVQRFATRLAHYVRLAPLNWFNFYDLWV
ncbi:acyltransferase, partial [Pseudomonas sp. GP01-A5]